MDFVFLFWMFLFREGVTCIRLGAGSASPAGRVTSIHWSLRSRRIRNAQL